MTLDTAGYIRNRQIFSDDEENKLAVYLKTAADIYYGLTPYETRKFAFEYAKKNNKTMPESWKTKLMAGEDWLGNFLKRHPSLSIRSPQATSLPRATSFNQKNVNNFFDNLKSGHIWNVDETGLTPQLKKGTLVTIAVAISALGNMVPPFFGFPRVHFKN